MEILDNPAAQGAYPTNFLRFLGTAGTRFVMLSQRRASGGIWFSYGGAHGVIDPGPGSLAQICAAEPPLSVMEIDTLILTHRHIDHSSDLSVLVEGMTLWSREPKGRVVLTGDSLNDGDSVLLKYAQKKIKHLKLHKDGKRRTLHPGTTVESVLHAHRGVECYGLVFRSDGLPTWGIISDTTALPSFPERYRECELLIVNVALPLPWGRIDHMSLPDLASLLQYLHPKLVLMTHMGGRMLDMGPDLAASRLTTPESRVVPARDGMIVSL